jgi:integrase/recombinase XerD
VERYQRSLHLYRNERDGRALSVPTQLAHIYAIRQFLKWLARSNLILYNPAAEVDLPRCERRLPRHVMSAQEAEQVLSRPDLQTPLGLRDRAILETFYSTALRRKELAQLSLPDLDLARGTVMVRLGKGHRDRVVPIGERAAAWLARYLAEVRPGHAQDPAEDAVFLTREGRRMRLDALSRLVSDYVRASGIGKSGACHLFSTDFRGSLARGHCAIPLWGRGWWSPLGIMVAA